MINWQKVNEENKYDGYRKIVRRTFKLPDGRLDDYDIIKGENACCVLALTKDDQIIIAKQFRPGPEKVLRELPGGGSSDGDKSPEEAIKRELLEETGYTGKLELIGSSWHCGYNTLYRYHFVATDCQKIAEPTNDENEFIEVELMSIKEFKELLKSGELTDSETAYRGLEYLKLI